MNKGSKARCCNLAMMIVAIASLVHEPARAAGCGSAALLDQRRDADTIERLEKTWTQAYLSGDTDLERCILSEDFTEILRTGELKTLQDELALAAANQGKQLPMPKYAKGVVLLHGGVAVAYGTTASRAFDGSLREMRYADFYVWDSDRRWHAFFAQQTDVTKH
jgi:hypothetical protein